METYYNIADLYKGIAKKTENLINKLNFGQKITRRETKELEELKKQAADKMNKSANYFLKSLGSQRSQTNLNFCHHDRNYNRNHIYSHSDRRISKSGYNNNRGGNHRR